MNRQSGLVSNSAIRRRVHVDLNRHLGQISDGSKRITSDCGPSIERDLDTDVREHFVESSFSVTDSEEKVDMCIDAKPYDGSFTDGVCWPNKGSDLEHSSDGEVFCESDSLSDNIASWAVQFGISQVALSALLSILNNYHVELPKDARTLLKTKTKYTIVEKAGGQYHYFGIFSSLRSALSEFIHSLEDHFVLKLQIHIDGLPLFKSSGMQLWPILGLLRNVPMKEPVVIGLFCGPKKPSSAKEFLADFVTELQDLEQGFNLDGKRLTLKLDTVICDTPARAFVKNTKSHNGYHGCDKCMQPGLYTSGRMTYPCTNYDLRTDESFENRLDENHHHEGLHPFHGSSVGMVSQFPVDYMHCVCLGVVRRLLNIWLRGPLQVRVPAKVVERMSACFIEMRPHIPVEFARKPRSLREIDRWKATEFREFLLYTGPVVLASFLDRSMYANFMLLFSGIAILVSPRLSCHSQYAHSLLVSFVSHFGEIYGKDQLVYNVHGLVHLPHDVEQHGCLDSISAFPFENYLHKLKRLVRKPDFPLAQVIRRLSEARTSDSVSTTSTLKKPHFVGPVTSGLLVQGQYGEMQCEKWTIKVSTGNNVFIIGEDVCEIKNIVGCSDGIYVVYKVFSEKSSFFTYPFNSDFLNVYSISHTLDDLKCAMVSDIVQKCAVLPHRGGFVAIPLFHT